MYPLTGKTEIIDFFNREARRYEQVLSKNDGVRWVNNREQALFTQFLHRVPGRTFLDIGVGTGRVLSLLRQEGYHVMGIDLSSAMLQQVRKKAFGAQIALVRADGETLPFRNASIENLSCIRVFKYFRNSRKTLEEFHRVLKEEGCALILFPNKHSYQKLLTIFPAFGNRTYNQSLNLLSYQEIRRILHETGFRILDTCTTIRIPFFCYARIHHRGVLRLLQSLEKGLDCILPKNFLARDYLFLIQKHSTLARSQEKMLKINLGSGFNGLPGWINLDHSIPARASKLKFLLPVLAAMRLIPRESARKEWPPIRIHDCRKALPFTNDSADCIYTSHFLEHLYRHETLRLLKECFRVLKPGGRIRIVLPNLEKLCRAYLERDLAKLSRRPPRDNTLPYTIADYLVMQFFPHELNGAHPPSRWVRFREHFPARHQWMYDLESISVLLREAGFTQITEQPWGESKIPDVRKLDLKPDVSLYLEARKEQ